MMNPSNRIAKFWQNASCTKIGLIIVLIVLSISSAISVMVLGHGAQINVDVALQNVVGNEDVNFVMIILSIINLTYLSLVMKSAKLFKKPYVLPNVLRQANRAVFYPIIFELLLLVADDIYKSVIATIALTTFLAFIVLNGIFIIVMLEYLIRQIAKTA